MGDNTKELTGYPSIDKPWLKYYSEEAINAEIPRCTAFEYMYSGNVGYEDRTALNYYGKKITYRELFDNIDKAVNAYATLGIKSGDVIAGITPSFPEVIYSFYALNKLGAVSDYFDPRTNPETVCNELKVAKVKAVIIFEDFIDKFKKVIDDAGISNVIVVSAKDSLPIFLKILMGLKGIKTLPDKWISYKKFIEQNQRGTEAVDTLNTADIPALMEHTGGTTGVPKAVVLSNYNINAVVHQYRISGTPCNRRDSWLTVAFPFTAYTWVCSTHLPLSLGLECVLCFDIDIEKISKLLLRNKINHMANSPLMWEKMISMKSNKRQNFDFLILPIVGADSLSEEKEKEINRFLEEYCCKYHLSKGYGMTEVGSAASLCITNECNKIGSVGIPFVAMNFCVVDIDSEKELPYGEQGEICMSGPSVMLGYFNMKEATDEIIKRHEDGNLWIHSGDLGHIDEDGFIFIDGRLKRMIINYQGFKIFAPHVEQILSACDCVEKCSVVGVKDKKHNVGQIVVAYIILRQGYKENDDVLRSACEKELPDYCVPCEFIYVKEFPYTSASKVDYRALEKQYENGEIN